MKWIKPDAETVELFSRLVPEGTGVEKRKMFGYPCAFVNGNMFIGVHNNNFIARLPESRREELFAVGFEKFEPQPGRVMKEYVRIPNAVMKEHNKIVDIFIESMQYASKLPKKK